MPLYNPSNVVTSPLNVKGSSGTLNITAASDGGDYNIYSSNGTQTLAIYGSAGNILNVNILDGVFFPAQYPTASAPAYVKGGMYFDTTLNKLRIGGASAWETVTSV